MTDEESYSTQQFRLEIGLPDSIEPHQKITEVDRASWLESICNSFVHPSKSNRAIYRVILETLWPDNHGIPGPVVTMFALREAVNAVKGKTYQDLARRIRELQGEEGVVGIVRTGSGLGTRYQLVHLNLEEKRDPRIGLPKDTWRRILENYNNQCAVCGKTHLETRLDQDHKIPRLRGGGDGIENWQPLCKECNNFKSTACRGCESDCKKCSWAFPDIYAPINLSNSNIEAIRKMARKSGRKPSEILNEILDTFFRHFT